MTLGEAVEIHGVGTTLERKGKGTWYTFTPFKVMGNVIFGMAGNGTKVAENSDDKGWTKKPVEEIKKKTILRKKVDNVL